MQRYEKISEIPRREGKKLLCQQKIRNLHQLEDCKLSVCHPYSAGIDICSGKIYVATTHEISAGRDEPIVRIIYSLLY